MPNDLADRIEKRLKELGLSARAASLQSGHSTHFLKELLRGKSQSMRAASLPRVAQVLEVSEQWLLTGIDPETGGRELSISYRVMGGGLVMPMDGELQSVSVTSETPADAFAMIVLGSSLYPVYGEGDVLVCAPWPDLKALFYLDAVLDLADGRRVVRNLKPGWKSGTFTLDSIGEPPMRDVSVLRAAKIIFVRKA